MTNSEKIQPLLNEEDFNYWKKNEEIDFQKEISGLRPYEIIKNFLEYDYSDYWYQIYYDIMMADESKDPTDEDKMKIALSHNDYILWLYYSDQAKIYKETEDFPHEILKNSFRWGWTKEGYNYWKNIYLNLKNHHDQQRKNETRAT